MGHLHPARIERPELTERELSYITLHTHFTRKQINDIYVRFHTHYPRGYINFEQFTELYANELKHLCYSRPLLERLFNYIDTDRNGQLNFKEILVFKSVTMPETDQIEKLRWIFFLYDDNDDQQIDRREFEDLCYLAYYIRGQSLSNERCHQLRRLFERFDLDHNGKLNCNEFIELCQQCSDILELVSPMFKTTEWNRNKSSKVG
jgi:Ca2+-binding EF-hand superfamily protein